MSILNLTQHAATPDQVAAGVVDLTGPARDALVAALTFETLPSTADIINAAAIIVAIAVANAIPVCRACGSANAGGGPSVADAGVVGGQGFCGDHHDWHTTVMIGGAPFLMGPMVGALRRVGVDAVFAVSRRDSVDVMQSDGSTRKTAVLRHGGFVTQQQTQTEILEYRRTIKKKVLAIHRWATGYQELEFADQAAFDRAVAKLKAGGKIF